MARYGFVVAVLTTGTLSTGLAIAQNYPVRTIRLIVPFSPGGGNDVLGRMFAQHISASTAQTVVVDNRAGGGGNIGAEMTAHAAADGYTVLYTTNSIAVAPSLYSKLSYKLSELAPVSLVASFPIAVIVHPSVPAKSISELIGLAKNRGGLNYGTTGAGSPNHLTGVLLNNLAGISNTHIPYKGAGPMMTAIMSGEVEIALPTVFTALPYVQSGRLRAVAVTTLKPSALLPTVPTIASIYPGFNTNLWHGYFTTGGTPTATVAALNREIVKALQSPDIKKALVEGGAEVAGTTPSEFATILTEDVAKYAKLVKLSGAKVD